MFKGIVTKFGFTVMLPFTCSNLFNFNSVVSFDNKEACARV